MDEPRKCPMCGGKGYEVYRVEFSYGTQDQTEVCESCDGTGKINGMWVDTAIIPSQYVVGV